MLQFVTSRPWLVRNGAAYTVGKNIRRTYTAGSDRTSASPGPPMSNGETPYVRGKKRKVALSVGYVGTGFHGLALNKHRPDLPTVDGELLRALLRIGVVAPSNAVNIDKKIHWNRSSRTDKGVHSCATIITLRCDLRDQHLPDESPLSATPGSLLTVPHLAGELNAILPPDIRVFDAVRVPKSFTGRRHTTSRTYEYLFPLDNLTQVCGEPSGSVLARMNDHCGSFVGSYNFHNFTSLRILKEAMHQRDSRRVEAGEITAGEMSRIQVVVGQGKGISLHSPEQPLYAAPASLFRTVERFGADVIPVGGREYVRFTVTANSFLYHQIRLMVGYAVLAAVHRLPTDAFRVVTGRIPIRSIPLAPAEGLALVNCSLRKSGVDYPDLLSPASQLGAHAFLPRIYDAISSSAGEESVFGKFVEDSCHRNKAMDFVTNISSLIAEADRLGELEVERTRSRDACQTSELEMEFRN